MYYMHIQDFLLYSSVHDGHLGEFVWRILSRFRKTSPKMSIFQSRIVQNRPSVNSWKVGSNFWKHTVLGNMCALHMHDIFKSIIRARWAPG